MKHLHPILVCLTLVLLSVLASVGSYRTTAKLVDQDLQQALAQTMKEQPRDVITADTIRTFNNHLHIDALRGQAILSLHCPDTGTTIQAHCPAAAVLSMSDQRPAMALVSMAFVWAFGCGVGRRQTLQPKSEPVAERLPELCFGGLIYSETTDRFSDVQGNELRFTPMQHQLMTMFLRATDYRVSKQNICEALWPKKDDASETLYTLIRRLKTVLEAQTTLTIESDRNRSYRLILRLLQ